MNRNVARRRMALSLRGLLAAIFLISLLPVLNGCSTGSSRVSSSYSMGYRGYYGPRPWGYYPGYGEGPIDPDWGVGPDEPIAVPLPSEGMPDMGMPDMGGMDMGGMDFGGFDF